MKLAVFGATGLVGSKMVAILESSKLMVDELIPVASSSSVGKEIKFRGKDYKVISKEEGIEAKPNIALFSMGATLSLKYALKLASNNAVVIDNSSAWRMDTSKKLIVPEINGDILTSSDRIISNPNCSTIQLLMVLAPLHRKYGIKRMVLSTYQAVSGSGKGAIDQLMNERKSIPTNQVYPYPIDLNVLPHIGEFQANGYTQEEMKMILETKKILQDDAIHVTATCVRVPVITGHSESVNLELHADFDLKDIYSLLDNIPGVVLEDNCKQLKYPMPLTTENKDEVYVGRIRRDWSQEKSLNLWVVADNLRKGAATNTIQILELLVSRGLI